MSCRGRGRSETDRQETRARESNSLDRFLFAARGFEEPKVCVQNEDRSGGVVGAGPQRRDQCLCDGNGMRTEPRLVTYTDTGGGVVR